MRGLGNMCRELNVILYIKLKKAWKPELQAGAYLSASRLLFLENRIIFAIRENFFKQACSAKMAAWTATSTHPPSWPQLFAYRSIHKYIIPTCD